VFLKCNFTDFGDFWLFSFVFIQSIYVTFAFLCQYFLVSQIKGGLDFARIIIFDDFFVLFCFVLFSYIFGTFFHSSVYVMCNRSILIKITSNETILFNIEQILTKLIIIKSVCRLNLHTMHKSFPVFLNYLCF